MGVLFSVVPSECFGIGNMLIQHLCYGFGLSLLVKCKGGCWRGGDLSKLSNIVLRILRYKVKMYLGS